MEDLIDTIVKRGRPYTVDNMGNILDKDGLIAFEVTSFIASNMVGLQYFAGLFAKVLNK